MSKGGRNRAAKRVEVNALVAKAAEEHEAKQRAEFEQRALNVFGLCRQKVINEPSLWPGEHIGALLAESLMKATYEAMLQRAHADMKERGVVVAS